MFFSSKKSHRISYFLLDSHQSQEKQDLGPVSQLKAILQQCRASCRACTTLPALETNICHGLRTTFQGFPHTSVMSSPLPKAFPLILPKCLTFPSKCWLFFFQTAKIQTSKLYSTCDQHTDLYKKIYMIKVTDISTCVMQKGNKSRKHFMSTSMVHRYPQKTTSQNNVNSFKNPF